MDPVKFSGFQGLREGYVVKFSGFVIFMFCRGLEGVGGCGGWKEFDIWDGEDLHGGFGDGYVFYVEGYLVGGSEAFDIDPDLQERILCKFQKNSKKF